MSSLGKVVLVVSNVGFLFPFWACFKAKKVVGALFFFLLCIVSSFYHGCKWGYVDVLGYGGYCLVDVTYEMFYAFDFFCSQMSIAVFVGFFICPKFPLVDVDEEYCEFLKKHSEDCVGIDRTTTDTSTTSEFAEFNCRSKLNGSRFQIAVLSNIDDDDRDVFSRRDLDLFSSISNNFEDLDVKSNGRYYFLQKNAKSSIRMLCSKCNGVMSHDGRGNLEFLDLQNFSNSLVSTPECDRRFNLCGLSMGRRFCKTEFGTFVEVSEESKIFLSKCETFYVLYHAVAIACALSLSGTSIIYVSLPLLIFNALFVIWLLVGSVASEIYKKRRISSSSSSNPSNFGALPSVDFWRNSHCDQFNFETCPFSQTPFGCNVVKSLEWNGVYKRSVGSGVLKEFSGKIKILYLVLAMIMGSSAIVLFSLQDFISKDYYPWTHSLWHLMGGLAFYLILDRVL